MALDLFQMECENCGAIMDRDNAVRGVLRCEYCKRSYVLPKEDQVSEVLVELELGKTNLNACAFTKAYGAYAKAVELDSSEPEGYFGMALAENKVQYLKDVILDKLVPVRYEKSGGKFSENAHYKKAVSLANKEQASVYREYAKEIDDVFSEFEKLYSQGAQYDCYLGAPVDGKSEEEKVAFELYERLQADGYKPFFLQEERKRYPKISEKALELFGLVSAKCFVVVCFDESRLKNKTLKNEYSRFIDVNKSVRKPKNNLTILFNEKPVEQIPGIYGKLQGIRYGDAFAYRDLTRYVDVMLGRVKPTTENKNKNKIAVIAVTLAVLAVGGTVTGIVLGSKSGENPNGSTGEVVSPAEFVYAENGADGYAITSVALNGNKTLALPDEYNGMPITSIGEGAFYGCSTLTSVTLPSSLSTVGANAFLGCSSLTELVLPQTVTEIGANAFSGCASLTELVLPQNVTELGDGAFMGCSSLVELELPQSITELGDGVFSGCSSLESVSVDFGLVDYTFGGFFGTEYFNGSTAVSQRNTSYYLPDSLETVTVMGEDLPFGAFQNCASVKSVKFLGEVNAIPNNTFQGCSSLTEVTLPQTLTEVGVGAFKDCRSLLEIELTEKVLSVGNEAFMNCSTLKTANLLCPTVTVGTDVFYGCVELEEMTAPCQTQTLAEYFGKEAVSGMEGVTISDNTYYVPSIKTLSLVGEKVKENGVYGFVSIQKLSLAQDLTEIGKSAFWNCVSLEGVDFTHVTSIGELAFEGCSSLKEIELPLTVESYGKQIFKGCSGLEDLTFAFFDGNETFSYLFGASGATTRATETSIVYTCVERGGENYNIPTSLKDVCVIGDLLPQGAFQDFAYISSVSLGEQITQIQSETFSGCSNLTNFSAQADLLSVGSHAFYGCESLVDYPLSSSTQSLGTSAFEGCSSLTQIFIPASIPYVGEKTFYQCTALKTAEVSHVTSFGTSAFEGCSSLKNLSIASAQSLNKQAFKNCSSLQSLTVPESVQSVGTDVFGGLTALTNLTWSVTEQATYSQSSALFDDLGKNSGGVEVIFSQNVTKIPSSMFSSSANVTKITFAGSNVTNIGMHAFYGLEKVSQVVIPSTDTWFAITFANEYSNPLRYGAELIVNGKKVSEISMPSDVTTVGAYQFTGMSSLKSFVFNENLTSVGVSAFVDCTGLEKIDVGSIENWAGLTTFSDSSKNAPFLSSQGDLYEKGGLIKDLVIPETVTSIGALAFKNMKLNSISLGTNVSDVKDYAFGGCEWVTKVLWNAPSASVSYKAFHNLGKSGSGVEVTIGADMKSVQYNLFSVDNDGYTYNGNINITKISFADGCKLEKIDGGAFRGAKISEFTIPQTVTVIGDSSFGNCKNLQSIHIPETVTSLGTGAFGNCTSLTDILWEASGYNTNAKIFTGSGAQSGLTVTLGENITSLPANFMYGAKLTELIIPENCNLTTIGRFALAGAQFTSFTVPETVTHIYDGVFAGCDKLTQLTLHFFGTNKEDTGSSSTEVSYLFDDVVPSSLKKITVTGDDVPQNAFSYCGQVQQIILQKDDLTIGKKAFYDCAKLKSVVCEGSVVSIGQYAFQYCDALETFTANGEIGTIEMWAFEAVSTLRQISAEYMLTVEQDAFYNCTALTELPNFTSETWVDQSAFYGCTGGLNVRVDSMADWCGVEFESQWGNPLEKANASLYVNGKLVEEADLTGVETVEDYAFYGYKKLTKVKIAESVTAIGKQAFKACSNLTAVETYGKASYGAGAFEEISTSVYIKNLQGWCESTFADSTANPAYLTGKYYDGESEITALEIPEGTNAIGAYSFYNCATINSLKVPTSVESGGELAFFGCSLTDIYWNARACADLYANGNPILLFDKTCVKAGGKISITIGPDVEIVPSYLFYETYKGYSSYTTEITSVTFLSTVCQKVGNYMFESSFTYRDKQIGYVDIADINAWSQIEFGLNYANPLRFTNTLRVNGGYVGEKIVLDDTLTKVGSATFEDFDKFGVTEIQLPSAIEKIGACAFQNNNLLTNITIPDTVTKIGAYAFYYCTNLLFNDGTTLDFLGNLTELGTSAFSGCKQVTELVIPNNPNLDYSTNSMFSYFEVENITIEEGVEELGNNMFVGCKVSGTLTVPSSVTTVGNYVFNGAIIGTLVWNADVTGERTISNSILASATIENLKIGKNVTTVSDYFAGGNDDVEDIEYYAFITNVIFEEGSVCEYIGDYAFYESRVQTCNLPATLKEIGDYAFSWTSLKECTLSEGLESIGIWAFRSCTSIPSVTIPSTVTYYGSQAFYGCSSLKEVYWNAIECADIKHIVEGSSTYYCNPFGSISTEAKIVIGNKVKVIPENLFLYCNAKEIVFEEGSVCEEIRSGAFTGNSQIKTLTLPASLKTIQQRGIGYADGRCSITDVIFEGESSWTVSWQAYDYNKFDYVNHSTTLTASMLTDSKQNLKYFTGTTNSSSGYGNCTWTKV